MAKVSVLKLMQKVDAPEDEVYTAFTFHSNLATRVMAIVAAFPSLQDLPGELSCNKAETMARVAALPVDFVARKRSYWRLAYNLLESPLHYQAHFDQILAAVVAFRDQRGAAKTELIE